MGWIRKRFVVSAAQSHGTLRLFRLDASDVTPDAWNARVRAPALRVCRGTLQPMRCDAMRCHAMRCDGNSLTCCCDVLWCGVQRSCRVLLCRALRLSISVHRVATRPTPKRSRFRRSQPLPLPLPLPALAVAGRKHSVFGASTTASGVSAH